MAEGDVRVPAGWYPDPLGLPQLRWWDNHAWTEYTSDARQPMVAQETLTQQARLAYADDDSTTDDTRTHPTDDTLADGDGTTADTTLPTAEALLSLEAPIREHLVEEELSPADKFAEFIPDGAPTTAPFTLDTRFDDLLGDGFADLPLSREPSDATATTPVITEPFDGRASTLPPVPGYRRRDIDYGDDHDHDHDIIQADGAIAPAAAVPSTGIVTTPTATGAAWVMALVPVYAMLASAFLLAARVPQQNPQIVPLVCIGVPAIGSIILAFIDSRILRRRALRPPLWILSIIPPVYLIARFVTLLRQTGRGFGPLLTFVIVGIAAFASVLAVPGLAIELQPASFSQEASSTVTADASALGAQVAVDCPAVPPMIVGQTFVCDARPVGGAKDVHVTVSLQQSNGFVSWRVDNWGALAVGGTHG